MSKGTCQAHIVRKLKTRRDQCIHPTICGADGIIKNQEELDKYPEICNGTVTVQHIGITGMGGCSQRESLEIDIHIMCSRCQDPYIPSMPEFDFNKWLEEAAQMRIDSGQ